MRKYTPKDNVQKQAYFSDWFFVSPSVLRFEINSDEIFSADFENISKIIEKAQHQIDAWQMIKNDVLALRGKHPESTSRENLLEEVKRINA